MRVTPLAVWAQNLGENDLARCVERDSKMTHSKRAMWDVNVAYCLAIKTLIRESTSENRAVKALVAAQDFSRQVYCDEIVG